MDIQNSRGGGKAPLAPSLIQALVLGGTYERRLGLLLALVIVVVLGTRFMAPRGFQDGNCFDFITLFQHIDQTSAVLAQSMVQGKGNHFTNSGQKTLQMRVISNSRMGIMIIRSFQIGNLNF